MCVLSADTPYLLLLIPEMLLLFLISPRFRDIFCFLLLECILLMMKRK